jgi:hypothetical protein
MEHCNYVLFYYIPEFLVEFYRKTIGTRCLVMFHFKDRLFDLNFSERRNQEIILLLGDLCNILCSIGI